MKPDTFTTLQPVKREVIAPRAFQRLVAERPHAIARSRFVAPRLGGKGFGRFDVEYVVPELRALTHA